MQTTVHILVRDGQPVAELRKNYQVCWLEDLTGTEGAFDGPITFKRYLQLMQNWERAASRKPGLAVVQEERTDTPRRTRKRRDGYRLNTA